MENYKIKVTEENRLAIKDIADRNNMNPTNLNFCSCPQYYYVKEGIFPNLSIEDDFLSYQEITFDQFKEMFDKVEEKLNTNELNKWLKSDSVYTALRRAVKSPSSTGVDDCEDNDYIDLYNLVCELRKSNN